MTGYKIMRKRHYKLGNAVDTARVNYGNRTGRHPSTKALAEAAIEVCSQSKVTFEEMTLLIQHLRMGTKYISVPNTISVAQTRNLQGLAREAAPIGDKYYGFSTAFWEALYERIRGEERQSCPSRLNSYFASRHVDSLRRYRDKHWAHLMGDKLICAIDFSACRVAFDADTTILDGIGDDMTYEMARPHVLSYWDQEKSSDPIMEVLLQGSITLGEVVSID